MTAHKTGDYYRKRHEALLQMAKRSASSASRNLTQQALSLAENAAELLTELESAASSEVDAHNQFAKSRGEQIEADARALVEKQSRLIERYRRASTDDLGALDKEKRELLLAKLTIESEIASLRSIEAAQQARIAAVEALAKGLADDILAPEPSHFIFRAIVHTLRFGAGFTNIGALIEALDIVRDLRRSKFTDFDRGDKENLYLEQFASDVELWIAAADMLIERLRFADQSY